MLLDVHGIGFSFSSALILTDEITHVKLFEFSQKSEEQPKTFD